MDAWCYLKSLIATVFAVLLFAAQPAFAGDSSCKGLSTATADALLASQPAADGNWFDHGEGCYNLEDDQDTCDWMVTVKEDRMIADQRRLIVVNRNHQLGSGDQDYVFVFGCVSGRIKMVFSDDFEAGAEIRDASADKLILSASDWREGDAHCCPSGEKLMTYLWNAGLRKYIVSSAHARTVSTVGSSSAFGRR